MDLREFKIVIRDVKDSERNEALGIYSEIDDIARCTIDLDYVISYYESTVRCNGKEIKGTIVDLYGGDNFGLLVPYDEFKKIMYQRKKI